MVIKKLKIVCSVKISRLEFVSLPIANQFQQNFYKPPCVEQRNTKLDLKITKHNVVKSPWIFIFIPSCLTFYQFLILFIYIVNIGYWQVLFITWSNQKNLILQLPLLCWRSPAAVLIFIAALQSDWSRQKCRNIYLMKRKIIFLQSLHCNF